MAREVEFRTGPRQAARIPYGPKLQRAAMSWAYTVRSRLRWLGDDRQKLTMSEHARSALLDLGLTPTELGAIARNGVVEVRVSPDEHTWEGRVAPWEYLLSAATRPDRARDEPLAVVRHLAVSRKRAQPAIQKAAFVLAAPGTIIEEYDFTHERTLPGRALKAADRMRSFDNPTATQLEKELGKWKPQLVHVAGVDTHQGGQLLRLPRDETRLDGLLLSGGGDAEANDPVAAAYSSEEVGRILGASRPRLVVFNVYNSGSRTAAMTVANGAGAAVGFVDSFDDSASELFLADLYRGLFQKGDVHEAFLKAMALLQEYDTPLHGSGVVLWSEQSLFATGSRAQRAKQRTRSERRARSSAVLGPADAAAAQKTLKVDVQPIEKVNASLLHNREPIFEHFRLSKNQEGLANDISVEVEMHVGDERLAYRRNLSLSTRDRDIAGQIIIPLTWVKKEQILENERSSLFVRVTWGAHEVYAETFPVTLLPPDEWVDSDEQRQWLPSFVQPRDPAVEQIVSESRAVLLGLSGELAQGFDGYQSIVEEKIATEEDVDEVLDVSEEVGDEAVEETAEAEFEGEGQSSDEELEYIENSDRVDLQVEAIWTKLVADGIGYINPPPAYTDMSQRLRMPSDIRRAGQGTCIDLTLLLASCLEYVEIYPAIILLAGHAFPAYWRSVAAHDEFRSPTLGSNLMSTDGSPDVQAGSLAQPKEWMLQGELAYDEVIEHVRIGNLVPLEATMLTSAARFEDAIEEGWENLRTREEFDAILDVTLARESDVTPLPIRRRPT
ncbi:MAG: hypothetical protein QNK05_25435 [Myxococcota bacterium]|nr:hypothetical protein [Myxococcota bacterium]